MKVHNFANDACWTTICSGFSLILWGVRSALFCLFSRVTSKVPAMQLEAPNQTGNGKSPVCSTSIALNQPQQDRGLPGTPDLKKIHSKKWQLQLEHNHVCMLFSTLYPLKKNNYGDIMWNSSTSTTPKANGSKTLKLCYCCHTICSICCNIKPEEERHWN